jgi:hypothetical protein
MKARLESRTPSDVWLVVENDTDADTQLQAVKIIVRWQDAGGALMTRSGPWKPCLMFLGPRMTFRLDVTNLLRKLIEDELPKLPVEKSVESAAELFTGAESAVFSSNLRLQYDGATQSFAPSP